MKGIGVLVVSLRGELNNLVKLLAVHEKKSNIFLD